MDYNLRQTILARIRPDRNARVIKIREETDRTFFDCSTI